MTAASAWLDATAQAALVRSGEAAPLELVDAAIARIERLDPALNAVIHRRFEQARAEARAGGLPDGPFRGVPLLVKDAVCHTAGDPYHFGMRVLRDVGWTAPADTWLAARFRQAGFVFLGKTNAPELAVSITTEPIAHGPTRNPWDPTCSPGGSSGGSAAAVASGMVAVAHANDMGGSIRLPAAMCGLVGLKPTRARCSLGPDLGEYWAGLTHEHVLTRSVRDSAAVLDAIRGPASGDPYTAPLPRGSFADAVRAGPGILRVGFRVASRPSARPTHAACTAAVHDTAALLQSLGHRVAPADVTGLDVPGVEEAYGLAMAVFVARELDRWSERLGRPIACGELEPMNAMLAEIGRTVAGAQYLAQIETLHHWARGVAAWWDHHDVLVLPTCPEPPFRLGELAPAVTDGEVASRMASLVSFTMPFNVTGQPAISLPLGWTRAPADDRGTPRGDGGVLPVGVQLVGPYGREDLLLALAAQLEAARPWAARRPAVAA